MRSNNKLGMIAALALGGCSGAWWHDPPASPAPATQPALDPAADAPLPQDASSNGVPYEPPRSTVQSGPGRNARPPVEAGDGPPPPVGTVKYDNVGYAVWSAEAGTVAGAHPTLPPGSFVEVTALDTGKTILLPITARSRPGREMELSGAAALELGLGAGNGQAGVRVRTTNPTGADIGALKAGRPAPARPDTPPVLLNALRRKLAGTQGQVGAATYVPPAQTQPRPTQAQPLAKVPVRPATRPSLTSTRLPAAPSPATANAGYYIQVAAVPDPQRAQTIAQQVGGGVVMTNGLYRVRFGPFDDLSTAQAARDDVAGRGYADARIVRQD